MVRREPNRCLLAGILAAAGDVLGHANEHVRDDAVVDGGSEVLDFRELLDLVAHDIVAYADEAFDCDRAVVGDDVARAQQPMQVKELLACPLSFAFAYRGLDEQRSCFLPDAQEVAHGGCILFHRIPREHAFCTIREEHDAPLDAPVGAP